MKLYKLLFIFLIGMISFTVLGSTTHREQKLKSVFKIEKSIEVNAVNVESNASFKGFISESRQNYINSIVIRTNDNPTINYNYKALLDVGWHFNKGYNYISHYKEKLTSKYKYEAISSKSFRIRYLC